MLVVAVGEASEWGKTMAMVVGEVGETPLQEHLTQLATAIGKMGLVVAVICFAVLMIRCACTCLYSSLEFLPRVLSCNLGLSWMFAIGLSPFIIGFSKLQSNIPAVSKSWFGCSLLSPGWGS